ncbi:sensor domain-containing protein [Marinicrinis lubricantis]|uniref:Sensor domain-containing protein n=1 Tax=Marinicrinis lubricantis TaxID=2086470 RepID=A0ABW1IUV8_9BACL
MRLSFFSIVTDRTAYASAAYLLISFPIGLLMFIITIVGISLSVGLIPLFLIGLPLFLALLILCRKMMEMDLRFTINLLAMDRELPRVEMQQSHGVIGKIAEELRGPGKTSILYSLLRFPISIAGFIIGVFMCATSLALLSSPLVYFVIEKTIGIQMFGTDLISLLMGDSIEPMQLSVFYFIIGIFFSVFALHVMKAAAVSLARVTVQFAGK